jgi:hypothetical protein
MSSAYMTAWRTRAAAVSVAPTTSPPRNCTIYRVTSRQPLTTWPRSRPKSVSQLSFRAALDAHAPFSRHGASSSWFICHDSLYNICALFRDEEWDFVRTWRLLAQVRYIEESGATIVIPHGILTLAAYWIDMNFSLVPREVLFPPDQTLRLAIAPSYALLFRSRSRSAQDIHAAPIDGDKRFLTVRRLFSKAHFSAIGNLPAYVAQSHLSYGVLLGVVECFPSTVWLRWGRPDAEPNLDFPMYAIWEATIVWLARLLDVVSPLLTMPKQPLTIELALSADCFESALDRDFLARHDGSSPISATAIGYGHYRLELLGGFFALAARPENDAERALMRAIFHMIEMAFAIQGGAVWPHTEEILDQVFEDRHARQFHLFAEQYPGEPHSSTGSNPEFVRLRKLLDANWGLHGPTSTSCNSAIPTRNGSHASPKNSANRSRILSRPYGCSLGMA